MVNVQVYHIPPTPNIPNSPYPLLHYPQFLSEEQCHAGNAYDLFHNNGWEIQWITRYSKTQLSHYHAQAHECMAVLTGTATIRFGTGNLDDGETEEPGGLYLKAERGDVFVIPAGVAHKTHNPVPEMPLKFLTPGGGHGVASSDVRKQLVETELSGFTMIGAYPTGSNWDWGLAGNHVGRYKSVWDVPLPEKDPVLGASREGIKGRWKTPQKLARL